VIQLEDVCGTVGLVLGHRGAKPDDRLMEDLGAESMDILVIVATIEEQFGITVDEAATAGIATVRDLYDVVLKSPSASIPAADPRRSA
jgi:acyl carrier protein